MASGVSRPSLVMLALGVAACSGVPPTAAPGAFTPPPGTCTPPPADTASWSPAASPSGSAAASAQTGGPSGFPIFPGSTRQPDRRPGELRWTTEAPGSRVYRFYETTLPERGFRLSALYPGGSAAVIRFVDRQGRAWQLSLSGDVRHTEVLLAPR